MGVFMGVVWSSSKSESYVNGPLDPGNLAIAAVGVSVICGVNGPMDPGNLAIAGVRFVICGLTEFSRGVPRP